MRSGWTRRAADPERARRSIPRRGVPVQRPPPGRVHARRRAPVRLGAPARATRRACATAAGWSATAWRPPSACSSRCRARRGCGWMPDGTAVVQSDMTDIGTGTYTIVTQVAADDARPAARSRAGRARALRLSGRRGVRRIVGRRQHVHRGVIARAAARCGEKLAARRRERVLARGRGGGRRDRRHVGRSELQRRTRSTPTAPISPKSASTPTPARSGCGGCWACSRRAASSTPRRRARS